MKRVLPRFLVVVVSGILIGVLSAAPALADDPRIPLTAVPVTLPAGQYCQGFDAVITFPDFNQYIVRSTTAPDGTVTQKITGHARATVTNQVSGDSVSFNISGPGTLVIHPDGSFSGDVAGPNLLWTARQNLANFPNVPTISYTRGHLIFEVDASGQTTSYSLAGGERQTDVCAVLAS
jgi:hypothetical protein